MTTTDTSNGPSHPFIPIASFILGLVTFIIGSMAYVCWRSGYGAFFGMLLDCFAVPFFFSTLITGADGLRDDKKGGFAAVGILLALVPPVATLLLFV
jgi:Na+/H+-dicarboxylate symporter